MSAGRSGNDCVGTSAALSNGAWHGGHANEENLFFTSSLPLDDFNLYSEQEFSQAAHDGKTMYADAVKMWEEAQAAEKSPRSNSAGETELENDSIGCPSSTTTGDDGAENTITTSNSSPEPSNSSSTWTEADLLSPRDEIQSEKGDEAKPELLQPENSPPSPEGKKFLDPKIIVNDSPRGNSQTTKTSQRASERVADLTAAAEAGGGSDPDFNHSQAPAKPPRESPKPTASKASRKEENLYFDPRRIFQAAKPKRTAAGRPATSAGTQPTASPAREAGPTPSRPRPASGKGSVGGRAPVGTEPGVAKTESEPAAAAAPPPKHAPKIENLHRMDSSGMDHSLYTEDRTKGRGQEYPAYIPPPERLYRRRDRDRGTTTVGAGHEAGRRKKTAPDLEEKSNVESHYETERPEETAPTPDQSEGNCKPSGPRNPSEEKQQQPPPPSDRGPRGATLLSSLWSVSRTLMWVVLKVLLYTAMFLLILLSLAINLLKFVYRQTRVHGRQLWHYLGRKLTGRQPEPPPSPDFDFGWSQFERSSAATGGAPPPQEGIIIDLPRTGAEAIKRLLSVKGRDPYTVLGVGRNSLEKDIKKAYLKQAVLVHPDKNSLPGAEEAFKILGNAYEILGDPGTRREFDSQKLTDEQAEELLRSFSDSLKDFATKLKEAANTLQCTKCGGEHKRTAIDRHDYFARYCSQCDTKHPAKEGDIWAETSMLGFRLHFYACMDKVIYDVSDWASCQGLGRMKANSHTVQVRIGVDNKQSKKKSSHQRPHPPREAEMDEFLRKMFSGVPPPPGSGGGWPPTPGGEGYPSQSQYNSAQRGKKKKRRKGK